MSSGFTPVPRAGIRACRDGFDRAGLLWLCDQGDLYRWEAFQCTNDDLCHAVGRSRGWPKPFLERMARAGVLTITDPGNRRLPRWVQVHSPVQTVQKSDQSGDQSGRGSKPDKGESDSSLSSKRRQLKEIESRAIECRTVWEAWHSYHKRAPKLRASDAKHISARLKEGSTVEELISIVHWAHKSPDGHADFLRKGKHTGLSTLFKPTRFDERLELAQDFKAGRAKPAQPQQQRTNVWSSLMALPGWSKPGSNGPPAQEWNDPTRWNLADTKQEHDKRWAAMRAAGGWRAYCHSNSYELNQFKKALEAAYTQEIAA